MSARRAVVAATALLAAALIGLPWMTSRIAAERDGAELVHDPTIALAPRTGPPPDTVRVLLWNIHHGVGRELEAPYAFANDARLLALGEAIARAEADVVVLNEVDFAGLRSGGVDQADALARVAGFPYRAVQRDVDVQLVLTPVRHGNVVLSRYPLRDAERLELPADRPLQGWFFGHRRALGVVVEHPDGAFRVVAAHFSHRDRETRMASVDVVLEHVGASELPAVVAGDLNATWTPLGPDDALHGLVAHPALHGPLDESAGSPRLHWGPRPPHVLVDWVVAPQAWTWQAFLVGEDALSDHPPVLAVLRR